VPLKASNHNPKIFLINNICYAMAAYPNEKDMGKRDQRLKKRMTEHEKSF
jgi:hypothetical protein